MADRLKVKFVDSGTSGPEWEGKSYIKHYITLRTDRQTDAGRGAVTFKRFLFDEGRQGTETERVQLGLGGHFEGLLC